SLVEATRFKTGWEDFNASDKNWAYRQDQLVTTHPIAGEVADTEQTFLNFDGITYGKGASTLKQLVATIGMDAFREGMRHYFRTHAYGNTTLAQFMAALETGSKRDLKTWADLWLRTPSLNTIGVEWQADGDRVSALSLTQTAPADYPTIRPHTVEVGLVRDEGGTVTVTALPASIDAARAEVAAAVGKPKPDLVFPNYNDHGYFKVALDPESVAFARENMERIDDPLLRSLLWNALWSMVRDQQMKSTDFLALVAARAAKEPRIDLIEVILNQAQTALARFVPEAMKEAEGRKLFAAARAALEATPPGDAKITWMRAMINAAGNTDDLLALARLADGDDSVAGLTVDQQMRWSIAIKHTAYDVPGAAARLEAEAVKDPSDRGKREQIRGAVSTPTAAAKAGAWEKFNGEGYGSLHYTEAAMGGFNWPRQRELLGPYVAKYFASVAGVVRERDKEFYSAYHGALFPAYRVEQATLDRSESLLAEIRDELPTLARMLRESNDELGRAIRCRAYAEG
ncbi:MAG: ERAP1-like C-terminal domain-containing protein, partial [Dehalococcoidia bacterium]